MTVFKTQKGLKRALQLQELCLKGILGLDFMNKECYEIPYGKFSAIPNRL